MEIQICIFMVFISVLLKEDSYFCVYTPEIWQSNRGTKFSGLVFIIGVQSEWGNAAHFPC